MSGEAQTTVLPPNGHRLLKDKHANTVFARMTYMFCDGYTSAVAPIIRVLERGAKYSPERFWW